MIVRGRQDYFLLFGQHEHALMAGELARRWGERPRPFESTVYAVVNHDLAWRVEEHMLGCTAEGRPPVSTMDRRRHDDRFRVTLDGLVDNRRSDGAGLEQLGDNCRVS